MKQSKLLRRISVAIVAVLLITMSVLSVTLAKYTTSITGTYNADAYTWVIKLNDGTIDQIGNFTIDLKDEQICPGMTSIVKTFTVKNEGEANATYTSTFNVTGDKPANLTITCSRANDAAVATLNAGATDTITVTIAWPYEKATGDSSNDAQDTQDQGKEFGFTLKIEATQVNPNPAS